MERKQQNTHNAPHCKEDQVAHCQLTAEMNIKSGVEGSRD